MEKLEWRDAFQNQPAYYLFLDLTKPLSLLNLNAICQVLQDMVILSVSLKGSSRFSVFGIYSISNKAKCIFPLQSVKLSYAKLQLAIDSIQSTILLEGRETLDPEQLSESIQAAVKQYESYYQGAVSVKEEWPQLQMVFFTAQPTQNFLKTVEICLATIELAYVRKIHVVFLRGKNFISSLNTSESKSDTQQQGSQGMFDNEEKESIIRSLLHVSEIEGNAYQLENIFKCWLHDSGTDSDHLRLTVGSVILRCDLRECLLNADSLSISGQFLLFPDAISNQSSVRANSATKPSYATKVPVYTLQAVAIVRKDGLCESLLFGLPVVVLATHCWKMDWDELERNQQQFAALVRHLSERNSVLVAKRQTSQIVTAEKTLPAGFFAFFPARNALLVKSLASKELLMPFGNIEEKEVSDEAESEIQKCLQNLEEKDIYNPMALSSGLYGFLSYSIMKSRPRPSSSFVVPIINKEETADRKKRSSVMPVAEVTSKKSFDSPFKNDFLTASAIYRKKFPNYLE